MEEISVVETLTEAEEKLPYLIFKIGGGLYAVNGETISSIFVLEQQVTVVPRTGSHINGIINVRGEVLPLVDLRVLLNMPSLRQEQDDFKKMIDARKQDHYNWVDALRHSVETDTQFTGAINPHECKFGKWYDHYHTENPVVKMSMGRLDEPHKAVHAMAKRVEECIEKKENGEDLGGVCYKSLFGELEKNIVPTLVKTLDDMVESVDSTTRAMAVILQSEKSQIGIIVDEVMEVTSIDNIAPIASISSETASRYICGVGQLENYEKDILLLDVAQVVNNSNT